MKIKMTTSELETRAKNALTETLGRMSGVNLKEIQCASTRSGSPTGFLAHVGVFGSDYTLTCTVEQHGDPSHIRAGLRDSVSGVACLAEDAKPVVIAPYFSLEAQAACTAADVGFLDLEGNAYLSVGEVFIAQRSFPCRAIAPAIALSPGNGKTRIVVHQRAGQQLKSLDNSREQRASRVLEGKLRLRAYLPESGAPAPDALNSKDLSQRGGI
jgi:hypothetical protein